MTLCSDADAILGNDHLIEKGNSITTSKEVQTSASFQSRLQFCKLYDLMTLHNPNKLNHLAILRRFLKTS